MAAHDSRNPASGKPKAFQFGPRGALESGGSIERRLKPLLPSQPTAKVTNGLQLQLNKQRVSQQRSAACWLLVG